MKHSDLITVASRLMTARETFAVLGEPGIGKTESIVTAAEVALGLRQPGQLGALAKRSEQVIITHPVIMDEVDFRGMPTTYTDSNGAPRAKFCPFGFLGEICEPNGPPAIVVLDDLTQARMSVQAGAMQLVHLRELDGAHVRDNVSFVILGNRREDKAGVQGFNTALKDRCVCVLTLDVDADEVARWLLANGYPPMLSAFVRYKPSAIQFDAKRENEKDSTPRSIAGLGRLLNMGLSSPEIVAGAVGQAFATEFLAYMRVESSLIPFERIVADPEGVPIPEAKDVLYAVVSHVSGKIDKDTVGPGFKFLRRLPPEYAVMAIKDISARTPDLQQSAPFRAWVKEHAALLGV